MLPSFKKKLETENFPENAGYSNNLSLTEGSYFQLLTLFVLRLAYVKRDAKYHQTFIKMSWPSLHK